MNLYITIIALGLLIFFSHAFNELFNKTKIPNALLLLLIGMIIGPISGVISKDFFGELGNVFTTLFRPRQIRTNIIDVYLSN